jgi:hypothetical protein
MTNAERCQCLFVKRDGLVWVVNRYENVIEQNFLLRLGQGLIVAGLADEARDRNI